MTEPLTWWNSPSSGGAASPEAPVPLAKRPVTRFDPASPDLSPGRRLRTFAALVCQSSSGISIIAPGGLRQPFLHPEQPIEYGPLLHLVQQSPSLAEVRDELSCLPLRVGDCSRLFEAVPEQYEANRRDPDLHPALQDLGDEISEDIREALDALDNPAHYYAGIDEGIDPVSDDHVALVIWALQRELNRELRTGAGLYGSNSVLPAAPLSGLPWNIQRALAERRRWRYREWGIGREQWQRGAWSLWDVPEDAGYVSRRSQRLLGYEAGLRLAA